MWETLFRSDPVAPRVNRDPRAGPHREDPGDPHSGRGGHRPRHGLGWLSPVEVPPSAGLVSHSLRRGHSDLQSGQLQPGQIRGSVNDRGSIASGVPGPPRSPPGTTPDPGGGAVSDLATRAICCLAREIPPPPPTRPPSGGTTGRAPRPPRNTPARVNAPPLAGSPSTPPQGLGGDSGPPPPELTPPRCWWSLPRHGP
jgi:hypothetical protein